MKLSGIITVPFHVGDFLSGTLHMDTLEKGAYIMLILAHYQSGDDGLPNDDYKLSRIAGVSLKTWSRIKPTMAAKFDIENDRWVSQKCLSVLSKVHEKSQSQREKALKKNFPKSEIEGFPQGDGQIFQEKNKALINIYSGSATAEPRQSQPKPKPKPYKKEDIILPPSGVVFKPDDVSDEVWRDHLKNRKAKKQPISETALKAMRKEADKLGWTLEQALNESCARGWASFKAEWVGNNQTKTQASNPLKAAAKQRDQTEAMKILMGEV